MNKSTQEQFATGAVRAQKLGDKVRYDLLLSNDVAMRRLAETFAEGFAKYGADNWKKGFPVSELWAHAFLHLVKWIAGDKTEDHLAHAVWNFMAIMWQEENKPELQDFPPIDPSNLDAIRKQEELATLQGVAFDDGFDYDVSLRCPPDASKFFHRSMYSSNGPAFDRCRNCNHPRNKHKLANAPNAANPNDGLPACEKFVPSPETGGRTCTCGRTIFSHPPGHSGLT